MAHETVTKSKRFYCVSIVPDFCKTPVGSSVVILPYTIKGEFVQSQAVSKSVKTHSEPVFLHNKSFIPSVTGDAAGRLGGAKSQTHLKKVESDQFSSTKGSNGTQTIQESRMVWMNNKNTKGRIFEQAVEAAKARIEQAKRAAPGIAKDVAQRYKDKYSARIHEFGKDAVDVGGKVGAGSLALGGAGLVVTATGVGAPVGAAMGTAATIGGAGSRVAIGGGMAIDGAATVADHAADYILTGKVPDKLVVMKQGGTLVFEVALGRAKPYLPKWLRDKVTPGNAPKAPPKPPANNKGGGEKDGVDGGKVKQEKPKKDDKPSDCCPKDSAPGGKPVKSRRPVHFGTGEEILPQTDFVLDGPTPLDWTRVYRSGSETEDWGLLGARWGTPYTSAISVCAQGTVYHDASGRALRLPVLATGQEHDHRGEGFVLRRDSDTQFTLTWRDGSSDTFAAGPDGWLPHGYRGVNAMLEPGAPARTQRFYLTRRAERDGTGITIERRHDARPGEVLLRVATDDGTVFEALRDALLPAETGSDAVPAAPRISRIEQVFPDGTRVCHVRYRYEAAAQTASDPLVSDPLPLRCDLVAQTNIGDQTRTYSYRHHLLVQYTTFSGFAHGLEWVSLAFLRERWAGNALDDAQLAERHPIGTHNSYQARAVRTTTADGRDEVAIAYIDADTTRVTEPDGGVLEYRFNAQWLATDVLRVSPDGTARSLGRRQWDRDGMLLADVDADGADTRYSYDAAGNLTTVTDAQDNVTRIDYGPGNLPVTVTDALGHATHSRYDDAGRLIERTDALGRSTGYRYDAQGRLDTVIDAKGGSKRLAYDSAGRLASYTDCSGFTSRYGYDSSHRLAEQVNAMGNTTRYRYDTVGRVVEVTHPDGTTERYDYDADVNLLVHTDPKAHRTRYRYDGHGQLVERIDAKGQMLGYRYDNALRVTELINGNGESYLFEYDTESRLTREIGFDGKATSYTYSAAGHLIATDSQGVRTDFARDALGRLLAKSNADGGVRYAYDALGRLTATSTREAENRFAYDPVGQLIDERMAYAPGPPLLPGQEVEYLAAFTMTHAYDELGNRIQTILPNGRRVDTLRYGSGHWHGTLWQGKTIVDLERDHLHRETVRELGSGGERLTERRSYDPQSRLSSFSLEQGAKRLRARLYEYDSAGNLVHIDDNVRGSIRYTYDPLGQLLSAVQPGLTETFAFDPAGNVLNPDTATESIDTRQILRELDEQPAFGTRLPRLAKVTHNLLRQYMGYSYEYDVQGNTVVKRLRTAHGANDESTLTFSYDVENRLCMAIRTSASSRVAASYSYDAFGRRISKRVNEQLLGADSIGHPVESLSTEQLTLFVWDGNVLAQEISPSNTVTYLYEPDGYVPLAHIETNEGLGDYTAATTHLTSIKDWYPPSPSGAKNGQAKEQKVDLENIQGLAHERSWQLRLNSAESHAINDRILHYQCDHLGTPLQLIDTRGMVAWNGQYRAWGEVQQVSAETNIIQPLRFQGQYADGETGLHYNRFRFYDPNTGRFVSQDPIRLNGGNNLYQYAPNPVAWVDPLGLASGHIPSLDCPTPTPRGTADFNTRMKRINKAIATHDYTNRANVNLSVPGGVSGAIEYTKNTGTLVGDSDHVQKGHDLKNQLNAAIQGLTNARSMTKCQKDALKAAADPYINKLDAALSLPQRVPLNGTSI